MPTYTFGNNGTVTTPDGRVIHRPAKPPPGWRPPSLNPARPDGQQPPPQRPTGPGVQVIGNGATYFPPMPETPPTMAPQPPNAPPTPSGVANAMISNTPPATPQPVTMRPGQLPHMVPNTNHPAPLSIATPPNYAPPQSAPPQTTPPVGATINNGNGLVYTWDGSDWKPDQAAFTQYMQNQNNLSNFRPPNQQPPEIPMLNSLANSGGVLGTIGNAALAMSGPVMRQYGPPRSLPPSLARRTSQ